MDTEVHLDIAPRIQWHLIKKAIELGADFLEVDIHLSKDDVLVVHHDPTLDRTTNGKGNLRDYTAAELKELDAGSWYHSRYKKRKGFLY
ncbi:glycerophosphodiester phosphodiesterase family protein [Peribacillus frigoritolerans]|nr:glycerophosphodiester phosphodiesterase family protein [Peribacillus frigoritolerans]